MGLHPVVRVYSRCWTLFVEAQKASVKGKTGKADVAANLIGKLYQIETAKANGLEPLAYLNTVLTRLPQADSPEAIERLLPWNQKQE
jgi:hypothetical protein